MASTVWNPENIKDIAESVGVINLNDDCVNSLSGDVEYRLTQVLEEALKFMRHAKRNTLTTQDVSQALRVLDVEPLYGYESTRALKFGEASIGPGQPLFYVEDEEVDFEKLINAPLPKVPREVTFTAHWLAVEGVQPSIPQNPTLAESRNQELQPKGASANPNLAAISGNDNVNVKPLVKHILSKELQLYFEKVTSGLLDESNDEYRISALASIRSDPGLHQLVPYFVQFVAEKVTHSLKSLFILRQMLELTHAMLDNETLHIAPYVASLVPPILTCLISPRLGSSANPLEHYSLRKPAASLLGMISKKYGRSASTLKPRLTRTCLKHFLDPKKPLATHFGAVLGIKAVSGSEGVRVLILPNIKDYSVLLKEAMDGGAPGSHDAEEVIAALLGALESLVEPSARLVNGYKTSDMDELRPKLDDKVGPIVADRLARTGRLELAQAVLQS